MFSSSSASLLFARRQMFVLEPQAIISKNKPYAKAMADRYPDLEAAAKLIMDGKLGLAQSKYNG